MLGPQMVVTDRGGTKFDGRMYCLAGYYPFFPEDVLESTGSIWMYPLPALEAPDPLNPN